jgi:ERCC4-type nuclease
MGIAHRLRIRMRAMLLAILLAAAADGAAAQPVAPETFAGALEQTSAEYQTALRTLETQGRDETAAAVHRLRRSFQELAERFATDRPPHLADDAEWPLEFMQIDVGLVGTLLVIEIGSQDAARRSLAPLADTLARLRAPELPAR